MPKKNKTLCVDDLRHAEYYGMQPVFDELSLKDFLIKWLGSLLEHIT